MWQQIRWKLSYIKQAKTFSPLWSSQSAIHLDDFQFTAGDGQSQIAKMLLPLFSKIKPSYLSVRSDEETNSSTSFITFLSCINLLRLFDQPCTPSRTVYGFFKDVVMHAALPKSYSIPIYLKSPPLCLVNTVLIYHLASFDTFPFPQLVWSCQHPLAPVCIPTHWDNTRYFL